jgi:hypothetical protein
MTKAEEFVLYEHLERAHCANECARCSETSPDSGCQVYLHLHIQREGAFTEAFAALMQSRRLDPKPYRQGDDVSDDAMMG